MNLQEHIRKVLREETQKMSPFILRRVNFNNIKKHIDKHLEEELEYLANRQWDKPLTKYAKEHSVRHIIEKVIDGIYVDSKSQLPIDVHRTYYSELEDYIKNRYYDYIYDSVKEYYSYYSNRKNK